MDTFPFPLAGLSEQLRARVATLLLDWSSVPVGGVASGASSFVCQRAPRCCTVQGYTEFAIRASKNVERSQLQFLSFLSNDGLIFELMANTLFFGPPTGLGRTLLHHAVFSVDCQMLLVHQKSETFGLP